MTALLFDSKYSFSHPRVDLKTFPKENREIKSDLPGQTQELNSCHPFTGQIDVLGHQEIIQTMD